MNSERPKGYHFAPVGRPLRVQARRYTFTERLRRWFDRHPLIALLVSAALVGSGMLLMVLFLFGAPK